MAGLGRKEFDDGDVLSAADVNGYLMDQSVMRFADSSARTAAIGTPTEGMVTYLDDVNQIEIYDGTAWVDQQAPILSEGTAGQYLQSNGTAGSQWVNLEIAENIITTEGDLIVGASDNTPERLPIGPEDTVLTSNGTAISWSVASGGGGGELYAAGEHTVSKDAGYYLVETDGTGPFKAENETLVNGINNLSQFTTLKVSIEAGITWTQRNSGSSETLRGVTYGEGLFVGVGFDGEVITSPDGITWTQGTSVSTFRLYSVTYGDSLFVAVGNNGDLFTSPDGITWTERTSNSSELLWRVTYDDGLFVVVGSDGEIITSPDAITWTQRVSGTTETLRGVTYGEALFVVVSEGPEVITSPDGITWTQQNSGASQKLQDVTYGDGLFVAVGNSGELLTSPDGITWTQRTSGASQTLDAVTYGDGLFVALGNDTIFTSPDGITWTERTSNSSESLYSVTYGDGLFVIVGKNGEVITSENETIDPNAILLLTELPDPIQP